MKTNRVIKIFLASSEELEADRYRFGNLIRKLDNIYEKRGIRIELFEWEDYDAAYNGMRKQDEYNERVRASDMFLALFHKKAGKFTIEEFNIARKAFDEQASPKIYTYIKDLEAGESESRELAEFKRLMLEELGHYWCRYSNFDTMQLHFVLQLQMVEATTPIKVEVKESQVKIGDSTIADLNNVPFTSENATHRELQSRKEQLDREIGNAESGGRRGFFGQRSRMTDEELANLREERESVTEQIERQEKALVDTAMSIARMQGGECSPRMRTAAELFEKGEIDKAEAVLKEDDMEADATNAKLKFDTAAQPTAELTRNIERCAGEYMLKARIVVSGIADESRYRQAVKLMSTAIDLVSGRLPEETLAEYLFDYAVLLTDTGQQTKALETWERLSGIYERLYRKAPQKYAYGYAGVLNNMAVLYSDKGDFDHCLSKYLKAIDIYDWLDREEPGIYDDDIARLKNNLGTLYSDRDEYNKALSEFNEAARIRFELLAKDNDPDSRSALADIYCNMATALQFSDHPQEALRYIAQAHAILDELDKEFPRIYEYKLYSILNREGSIYTRLDQLDKAEESLQKSLQLATNLASRMPLAHSADLATAKMEMSGLNYVLGKNEEARKGFCQALDIFRRLQTKEPVYDHPIATVLQNLGVICRHEEKYEDAEKFLKEALDIRERKHAQVPYSFTADHAKVCRDFGDLLVDMGENDRAGEMFEKAVTLYTNAAEKSGHLKVSIADSIYAWADTRLDSEEYDRAESLFKQALSIYSRLTDDKTSYDMARTWSRMGDLYMLWEKPQAVPSYEKALSMFKELHAPDSDYREETAHITNCMALISSANEEYDRASELYEECISIYESLCNDGHDNRADLAEAYCSLGETHCNLEAAEPARECFEKSLKLYREINACPVPLHIDKMAVVLKKLGIVLYVCEEYDTATTLYLEAYELLNTIYRKTGECGEELGSVALCLSEAFADTGKSRKARKYYDIALKFGAIEEDDEEDYNDDEDEENEIVFEESNEEEEDMEEDDEDGECEESNETDEARTIEDIRIAKKNAHRFKTASDYLEAAKRYTDKGDLQKAKELYIDAIDICEKYLVGGFTEDTYRVKAECCRNFADIIKEEGRLENAMAFYQEALRIYKILKFYSPDYEQALSEVERRIKIFT